MGPQSIVTPNPLSSARARWLVTALLVGTALAGCKEDAGGPPPPQPIPGAPTSTPGAGPTSGPPMSVELPKPESLTPVIPRAARPTR